MAATAWLAVASPVLASLAISNAEAQERLITLGRGSVSQVVVPPGSTITIKTSQSFSDIVVGNSDVADVVPLTERSLYVQGKGPGTTNISIYSEAKALLGVIDVRVRLDFEELNGQIRAAVPSARITVSNVNNQIRLSGVVKDARDLTRVLEIAQQYSEDPVINQLRVQDAQQVMLEVRVIEASRQAGRDLGIGFRGVRPADNSLVTLAPRLGIGVDDKRLVTTVEPVVTQNGTPFGETIAKILEISGWRIDLVINALEGKGLVRRLAQPNLTSISGETASFHAGGEVPILNAVQGENGSVATETSYRPYGVKLSFTPVVLDNGLINLTIVPEVSELDRSVSVNGNPGFISRRAQATIELRDGQSFAMAGLLQTINGTDVKQLPWLGQVPVLGALFRSTSFQKRESDLVIVVTPRIVRPASPDEKLYSPLGQTRPGNDVEMFMLGMLEVDKDMIRGFRTGKGVVGPYGHIIDLTFEGAHAIGKK
ncbi:type II and III secretion system protein family protein [Pseudaminobacter sp. 19-2017]|uniref:Type II and III secretion system protein family protein n=1 Tax=Pseudaminobacter soli (ex Zhang et al. 2022) TaxID=2831468 RepID=A0A942DYZ5_9HYPH|nr:type II and III secretion system protein family protein [Pseudaminobacter soli]MBS3648098.1 type II and III secretion system protein family protein [Pseudaminobacter soli]